MSPAGSKNAPEAKAREKIDALLAQAGWLVQYREDMNRPSTGALGGSDVAANSPWCGPDSAAPAPCPPA
jgi:type I site-specific restriction endonuclease